MEHFEENVLKATIRDRIKKGDSVYTISQNFQDAYKSGYIDKETFFLARSIYLSYIGIKASKDSDDYEYMV